eukprot:UN00132
MLSHFEKMSLTSFFLKKVFWRVKCAKTNGFSCLFSSIDKVEANKIAKSFPTYT